MCLVCLWQYFTCTSGPDLELYRAAARGDAEKVDRMLEQDVDVEFTLFGWTPLMVACSKGHMWGHNMKDVIKSLLRRGANIEAVDNGEKGFKVSCC